MCGVNGERFDSAVRSVEPQLKKLLQKIDCKEKANIFEIRIRSEKPVVLTTKNGVCFLSSEGFLQKEITQDTVYSSVATVQDTFNRLCCYSVHSHLAGIVKGYITMEGGHRAGITGTAVCDRTGCITSLRDISGINIRVSREVKGCADSIVNMLYKNKTESIIVAGPPASGKTTVLRDAVRQLASKDRFYKIALIDERQEIASINAGIPQNDVGVNTDVLDGFPKGEALMIALKTLSPDIIALDEVGEETEIEKIRQAVNSGVKFLVTVHAADYKELIYRPQIQKLIETFSFSKVVMLKKDPIGEIDEIYDTKELRDEIIRRSHNMDSFDPFGLENVCSA